MRNDNGAIMYRVLIYFIALLCPLFSPVGMASQTNQNSMEKTTMGKITTVGAAAETLSRAVPPIDRATPSTYKTATFGLG
jgi:hypothetical protein